MYAAVAQIRVVTGSKIQWILPGTWGKVRFTILTPNGKWIRYNEYEIDPRNTPSFQWIWGRYKIARQVSVAVTICGQVDWERAEIITRAESAAASPGEALAVLI